MDLAGGSINMAEYHDLAGLRSEAQRRMFLPNWISGEQVGVLAMSAAGAASDAVSMRLRADRIFRETT
jgi:alkylation response protein AidB-like acyl-CoA dehydrogenase